MLSGTLLLLLKVIAMLCLIGGAVGLLIPSQDGKGVVAEMLTPACSACAAIAAGIAGYGATGSLLLLAAAFVAVLALIALPCLVKFISLDIDVAPACLAMALGVVFLSSWGIESADFIGTASFGLMAGCIAFVALALARWKFADQQVPDQNIVFAGVVCLFVGIALMVIPALFSAGAFDAAKWIDFRYFELYAAPVGIALLLLGALLIENRLPASWTFIAAALLLVLASRQGAGWYAMLLCALAYLVYRRAGLGMALLYAAFAVVYGVFVSPDLQTYIQIITSAASSADFSYFTLGSLAAVGAFGSAEITVPAAAEGFFALADVAAVFGWCGLVSVLFATAAVLLRICRFGQRSDQQRAVCALMIAWAVCGLGCFGLPLVTTALFAGEAASQIVAYFLLALACGSIVTAADAEEPNGEEGAC